MRDIPDTTALDALEAHDGFVRRHIGPDAAEIEAMLRVVGASSLEALIDETVPDTIRLRAPLAVAPARSEREALETMRGWAAQNKVATSLIGMGYHGTITERSFR